MLVSASDPRVKSEDDKGWQRRARSQDLGKIQIRTESKLLSTKEVYVNGSLIFFLHNEDYQSKKGVYTPHG